MHSMLKNAKIIIFKKPLNETRSEERTQKNKARKHKDELQPILTFRKIKVQKKLISNH